MFYHFFGTGRTQYRNYTRGYMIKELLFNFWKKCEIFFFQSNQTGSGTNSASYPTGTGKHFSWWVN
jgi:hypothetical protein